MPRSPPHPHPPHRPAAQKPPLVRGRLKTLSLPEWSDPVRAVPPRPPPQCFHVSIQSSHPTQCFHAPTQNPRAHANVAQRGSAQYLNALRRDSRHLRHSTHDLNPAYHPSPPAGCYARGITPQPRDTPPIPPPMPHPRAPPSREPPAPSASTVTAN